jgi:hypothetical protein
MSNKVISISIKNLFVNIENPRFEPVSSQEEAILEMAKNQEKNLINLGKSIIEEGLNPSELPIVTPDINKKGNYIVLEGNRRLTTIKILKDPDLIKPLKNLYNQFTKYSIPQDAFVKITCVVFDDINEAYQWIELKHTGMNQGIGTVPWDSKQIKRFQGQRGKNSPVMQLLEFAKAMDNLDSDTNQLIEDISITNLERLIKDPYIREFLGIYFENGILKSSLPKEEVKKGIKRIITDLSQKKINVNNIRKKEDRQEYVESFAPDEIPQKENLLDTSWALKVDSNETTSINPTLFDFINPISNSNEQDITVIEDEVSIHNSIENELSINQENNTENNNDVSEVTTVDLDTIYKKSNRLSTSRKSLIPSSCILKIPHSRINKIYYELKKLEVNNFENSVAILFRVFVELSLDYYGIEKISQYNINDNLNVKIQKIANLMEANKSLNKYELKSVRTYTSSSDNLFSTNTLNAYVHNKDFIPKADDLKITWDNYQNFICTIWNSSN